MTRQYRPAITLINGSDEFELACPGYSPINNFRESGGLRQARSIVARRAGAVSFLPGVMQPLRIEIDGSFGDDSAPTEGTQHDIADTMRDTFIGHFLRKANEFRLYYHSDRYCKARNVSWEFPTGRAYMKAEQDYRLLFEAYDPFWYDVVGDQSACAEIVLNSECIVIPIGGNAPTPVRMTITIPADCTTADGSCLTDLRWDDVGGNALDVIEGYAAKHYFEIGDISCFLCPGTVTWNPTDGQYTITVPGTDCTHPLEWVSGYWFKSGPGDTTICFTTPSTPMMDCTATVCLYWHDRWFNK